MPHSLTSLSATLIVALGLPMASLAQESGSETMSDEPAETGTMATEETGSDGTGGTDNMAAEGAGTETTGDAAAETATVDADADTVVATVNGTDITLGHMILVAETLPQQYRNLPNDVLWDGIMEQLIQQTVLVQSGDGEESPRVTLALDNERRALMAAQTVQDVAQKAVSDEAVQAAYDDQYANAEKGKEFNASHILVETEDEANAIKDELEGGADFAALAQEKSTGPSGPNGGELGWFSEGMMVPAFEDAVKVMEVGAVSDPVQTQFGWHVIKLNETRAQEAPALDEVRGEIEQTVQRAAVEALIDELISSADVEKVEKGSIDPTLLRNSGLLED